MAQLYAHQQRAVEFVHANRGGFLAYETGTGKTFLTLEAFRKWKAEGYRMLVICPLTLIVSAWQEDNARFTQYRFCNLRKPKDNRDADIYAINFEALLSEGKRLEIIELARKHKLICVIDESSRISNPQAKTTKYMLMMRRFFEIVICLTGTPCSQSETQWWSQIQFVRPGTLQDSFFAFRNTYFHLQRGGEILPPGPVPKDIARTLFSKGWKYAITQQRRAALMDRIGPIVRWQKLDDCIDMPPEVDEKRLITMTDDQRRSYKMMKEECITEIREKLIPATTALTKLIKLRTITSGFAYTPDGAATRFEKNPKLDELMDVLEEIGDRKVVIFCNFKAEIEDIKERLGDRCVTIDGETDDKSEEILKFRNGGVQYLVANEASISHGVTLVEAQYMVFYSHSYSAEKFTQARARIRRIGQKGACVYIHMLCEGTIDEVILDVLKNKQDAVEVVRRLMTNVE